MLNLHLTPHALTNHPPTSAALTGEALTGAVLHGQCDEIPGPLLVAQIREWCGRPDTRITVQPVIDLTTTVSVDAYEVPDRIRTHLVLRDRTCVFPWCNRSARPGRDGRYRTDCDHIVPHAAGGATSTDNLAPLCRRHHRLKTHAGWRYRMLEPGWYHWTSPHGLTYLRNPTGTSEVHRR